MPRLGIRLGLISSALLAPSMARAIEAGPGSGPVVASLVSFSGEVKRTLEPSGVAPMKAAGRGPAESVPFGAPPPLFFCEAETWIVQASEESVHLSLPLSGLCTLVGLRRRYS